MKRFLLLLLVPVLSVNPRGAIAAPTAKVELKHTSSFALQADERNPFWPIGWKPANAAGATAEVAGPTIPPSSFVVSSIMLDPSARFAIINGKVMGEGQQFGLQMSGQVYQLTVKSIQDGRVILARGGEEIIVPLRRR
ncbi:MAG: hypothetical protein JO354_09075 [Verrucomicrobia bacterium]|nr:hypothetical protein [Verrucomicrobiota bacterium]